VVKREVVKPILSKSIYISKLPFSLFDFEFDSFYVFAKLISGCFESSQNLYFVVYCAKFLISFSTKK